MRCLGLESVSGSGSFLAAETSGNNGLDRLRGGAYILTEGQNLFVPRSDHLAAVETRSPLAQENERGCNDFSRGCAGGPWEQQPSYRDRFMCMALVRSAWRRAQRHAQTETLYAPKGGRHNGQQHRHTKSICLLFRVGLHLQSCVHVLRFLPDFPNSHFGSSRWVTVVPEAFGQRRRVSL